MIHPHLHHRIDSFRSGHALHDAVSGLVDQRHQHTVRNEARRVIHRHRLLLQLLCQLHRRFKSRVARLQRPNHFHQHHHRDRIHEVHPHKPVRPLCQRRQGGHGNRRRIARDDHLSPQNPVRFVKHRPLDLDFLRHRFNHEIRRRNGRHVRHRLQPAKNTSLLRNLPLLDFPIKILANGRHPAIKKALLHVAQNYFVARTRKHVRDPVPHRPRAQHRHRLDFMQTHPSSPTSPIQVLIAHHKVLFFRIQIHIVKQTVYAFVGSFEIAM